MGSFEKLNWGFNWISNWGIWRNCRQYELRCYQFRI